MKNTILLFVILALAGISIARKDKNKKNGNIKLSDEARLYKHLIDNYDEWNPDRVLRPVFNKTEGLVVNFGLAMIHFLEYNEDTNIGTFLFWDRYSWKDVMLQWQPDEYGQIDNLRVPIEQIWRPDIVLYNNINPALKEQEGVQAVIAYTGDVLLIPPIRRELHCPKNDSGYVICRLKFGSWVYDGFKVDVDFYDGVEAVDITDYVDNKDYNLIDHSAVKHVKYYPCCVEPYPDLTFNIVFSEKSSWWG